MTKKRKHLLIIDGNALVHRAFHALPPLTTKKGVVVNAVYGFTMVLLKALRDIGPAYIAVAFDRPEPTFRDKAYAPYKAHREKKPQDLYDQIPIIQSVLAAFHIPTLELVGFEADDILGTVAARVIDETDDVDVDILTGDLDTLQLVNDRVRVLTLQRGLSETKEYDTDAVVERYGIRPDQMIDYKALRGDTSDNIPGVKGIGEKTASSLIAEFDSLDGVYAHLDSQSIKEGVRKKLEGGRADADISKELVTIVCDAPVSFSLADSAWDGYDKEEVFSLFQELGFRTLLTRLPDQPDVQKPVPVKEKQEDYIHVDTPEKEADFFATLARQTIIAIDTETDSLNALRARLIGVSVSWKAGSAHYIDVRDGMPDALRKIIGDARVKKIGQNIKYDLEVFAANDVTTAGFVFDTMIASYVLNASTRQHNLDTLAFQHFGYTMTPIKDLIGTGKQQITMADVPRDALAHYACEDADITWRLYELFAPQLAQEGLQDIFERFDMPLVPVLIAMETAGIALDTSLLATLSAKHGKRLALLEKNIWKHAGHEFNIKSPKQLKEVLFVDLEISTHGVGKTKTGLSTAASQLEKLRDAHPIIPLIMEYRELAKLTSTYLDALPLLVDEKDARVHTSYNQTVAATGRLSSSDPNLQNIPVRTELGNEIRKAFVAPSGYVLLAADYSQIELRIAAHLSQDERMIAAFENGEDIHARTAAAIHDIDIGDVTREQRYAAKTVNFGVLYGMGSSSVAKATGFSRDEARDFIEKYFAVYPKLHDFLETTKALAHKRQFAETMYGRRRPIPEIQSRMPQVRAGAERMAINMPMQGSQSDILKLAMIEIHAKLQAARDTGHGMRMLLQVHDELIFECSEDDVRSLARMVRDTMENIEKLRVPLISTIKVGKSWGEMETLTGF
jgi:DNA polymerase I